MGFWEEMSKPALYVEWEDNEPPRHSEELKALLEENRKLKLIIKKMLEQGITERKIDRRKAITAETELLE